METPSRPKLLVAVGASAGGIEACRSLLEAVPSDLDAAFILVLHLDPKRASHLAEILQPNTEHLRVEQAVGTVRLEPHRAYVIAPNSKLQIVDGSLEVETLGENEVRGHLVDYLFSSIAEVEGERAVGIVLSGAGSDGTRGLGQIRGAGGLCLAQDPAQASSPSMPQAAIEAGVVDAVLAVKEIPETLAAFAHRGLRPEQAPDREPGDGDDEETRLAEEAGEGFQRVLERLAESFDVNFGDYKVGTLERRTQRRMSLRGFDDWGAYAAHLADHADELEALYGDLLIGVTEFFRDPEIWEQLAAELPPVLEGRQGPAIRAWVPGCGTGEEAYSLAMLLLERVPARDRNRIQIFATDLDERALAIARRGIYGEDALEQVDGERRQLHFNQRDGRLQIDRRVRDCLTFAPHNLLSDPPFSRMDLVSCRNLLIYLKPQAHDRVLKRLHFALRSGGLLVLGRSEALGRQASLFEEISKGHHIFRSRAAPRQQRLQLTPRPPGRVRGSKLPAPPPTTLPRREPGPERRIEQFVLRERTPASVVVNSDLEIRHFYGPTQRYLMPPTGESRPDLLAWLRPGLHVRLGSAVRETIESGEPIATEGQIEREGGLQRVQCTIEPLPAALGADEGLLLVTFRDLGESALGRLEASESQEPLVRELEQELLNTRRELQTTIEQLESADEEHRAGQEELQSINEELQSGNEELEASKEELEALNEEMNTINREFEEKNIELRTANNDLANLFTSTGIPTVFLDRGLRVRRYTEAATELLRLVASDVGRSIEHVKECFDDGETTERCRRVLETLEPDESEVRTGDGGHYQRRIVPYRTSEGEVDGVCLTFTDVTPQRREAEAAALARAYAEEVITSVRTPVVVLDDELRVVSANPSFEALFEAEGIERQRLSESRDARWNVLGLDELLEVLLSQGTHIDDVEVTTRGRTALANGRRVRVEPERDRIVLSFEEVTAQREARQRAEERSSELAREARRKDEWIAMLGHELRNPLGAISNAIELLKSASLPEQEGQVVGMIERQGGHMRRMLDELLDASRIAAGTLQLEREPVDLAQISQLGIDAVTGLMQERQHDFSVTLPAAGSLWVRGDAMRLTQLVTNLLSNAARFTPPGGRVALDIRADGVLAVIDVSDDGIGISPELMPSIFEIFVQGPRALGRTERGLGLGLPLVRSIAQLHGGEVEVSSEGEGQGSTFRVTLPRLEETPVVERPMTERAETEQTASRRILIVDDVGDAATTLERVLAGLGHEVCVAGDATAALEMARGFAPEVALLDLGLPGMDGYELASRLREIYPEAVLIAVTGYQRDAARLETAGFQQHLSKPIDLQRLASLLAAELR